MNEVVVPMRPTYRGIHDPRVVVRARSGAAVTAGMEALVDTGSPWTLAHESVASALGLGRMSAARTLDIALGGRRESFWEAVVDLDIAGLALANVKVYFGRLALAERSVDLLLGQHEVLERLVLVHLNQAPRRRFILRVPE